MKEKPPQVARTFAGTDRFQPRQLLGVGGMGLVYRVYDAEMSCDVALKMLHHLGADQIYQLKAEFRALRGVLHPNLVQLYELFVEGEDGFFTMELVRGVGLGQYLDGPVSEAVTEDLATADAGAVVASRPELRVSSPEVVIERLGRVATQLVLGVAALHQASTVHRDLKPSNVMIAPDHRLVILDFGLASAIQGEGARSESRRELVGTPPYMAPEQAWGMPPSPEADWYSVGVLLYEALTGRLPFDGHPARVLRDKSRRHVRPPREIVGAVPQPLSELVMELLHPNPAHRPRCDTILRVLGSPSAPGSAPFERAAASAVPFVGRAAETATLVAAFAALEEGRGSVIRIAGAAGIGKTELVQRFLASIETRADTLVLRGVCHRQESVPYKAFDPIVDELASFLLGLPDERARDFVPPGSSALTRLFSVLAMVPAFAAASEPLADLEPQEIRRQGFRAMHAVLASVARTYRLVLWIDDVQWGDADSALLLREMLRREGPGAFLLLLSHRSEERALSPFIAGLRSDLAALPADASTTIALEPLADGHAEELLRRLLGERAEQARHILADSGGSPFLLGEVARELSRSPRAALEPATPVRVTQVVRDRLARLSERERGIIEIVAISGGPLDRSVALAAAGLGEGGRPDVQRLGQACLLSPTDRDGRPAIETYHDRIREAALEDLTPDARRERHLRLADALELESSPAPDPEQLVEHLLGAGAPRRAGRYAALAGDQAAAALAFDQAARMFELAVRHHTGVERFRLQAKLAEALADAGRGKPAAERFAAAAQDLQRDAPGDPRVLDFRRRSAEQYLRSGHVEEGVTALRQVLAAVKVAYPSTPRRALASVVWGRARLWARGLQFRPRPTESIDPAYFARMDACWSAGLGLAWVDQIRAAAFQVEYTLLALDAGERSRIARALATEASQLTCTGDPGSARRGAVVLAQAERLAAETGDASVIAFCCVMAATVAFYRADWGRALSLCRQSEELIRLRCRGMRWETTTAHILALASLVYLGRMTELRGTLDGLLTTASDRGDLLATASLASGLPNMAWLAADAPDEARRQADRAMALWPQTDFQAQHYFDLLARTQIDLYTGDAERALDRITRAWPTLRATVIFRVQNFRVTLLHLRARASLAAAAVLDERAQRSLILDRLRRDRLLRLALADAKALAREPLPWAEALALLIRASAGAARRPATGSVDDLRRAAELFDRLGMELYAAAIRHRLGHVQGGTAGRELQQRSEAWMSDQGVQAPARLAAMLVPGVRRR